MSRVRAVALRPPQLAGSCMLITPHAREYTNGPIGFYEKPHHQRRFIMAGRNFLFVPGPTNVPDRVQRAMVVAMEDHRSSKFPELTLGVLDSLKKVFKTTTGIPIIFPSSGTGCWEAALTNCLSPGDKVLPSPFGQLTHLLIAMTHSLAFYA